MASPDGVAARCTMPQSRAGYKREHPELQTAINRSADIPIEFAHGVDVLVMHMPVPEKISGAGRKLHAPPSIIGIIAANTGTGNLVLNHFLAGSLDHMNENLIQARYTGQLLSARDRVCMRV